MKKEELLQRFGLTHEESVIYTSLLERGSQTVAGLSATTIINRTAVYKAMPALEAKGLVSPVVRGKRRFYAAESPERLESLLRDLTANFQATLPEWVQTFNSHESRPLVKFLPGREGIAAVYGDIVHSLKKGDVFYRYSSSKSTRKRNYVPAGYEEIRDRKGLERYVITNAATAARKRPRLDRYEKVVPAAFDIFEYNITQIIYGNKIAFVDYNTETATIIENPVIADFQRKLFKLLFSKL